MPIQKEEVQKAILDLNSKISPGKDGLTSVFYKTFDKDISPVLTELYNNIYLSNNMCMCMKQNIIKKVREKSRECHNHKHKPQPFRDPKRKRKLTNQNKQKPNKRTKSTKISSLFPKRGNRNTKRTEKHKNKMIHGKTYNKSPRRINHKATRSKTNTGTTALERSVEQTTGGLKHFYS